MNKTFWFCVVGLLLLAACKKDLLGFKEDLVVDDFNFRYLTARARISYQDGKQNVNATANIRMRKDSVIWMSVSKLGIEGARLKVDKDSIYIIDRLKKRFRTRSFADLSKDLDFQIDYHLIESVVLGNLIYPYSRETLERTDLYIQYNQQLENFLFNNYIGAVSKKLEKLTVEDTSSKNTISVNYGDFKAVESEIFPFSIAALIDYAQDSKENIAIKIGFSRAQIGNDPLSFPFGKPSKYKRI